MVGQHRAQATTWQSWKAHPPRAEGPRRCGGSRSSWAALVVVLLLPWLASACSEPDAQAPSRLHGDSPLLTSFFAAEERTGVPAELLATIAYLQTRLREPPADADSVLPREWGIMAIGAGGLTSLEEAAAASGASVEAVASDSDENVLAAASLLARNGPDASEKAGTAGPWLRAVEAYGGEPLAAAVAAWDLHGWQGVDAEGRVVILDAVDAEDGVGTATSELSYPGAIWNPAYSGNYTSASRGAAQINYVVIHTTQGSYAGAISWFKNPSSNVSSHYVLRSSDGQITAMVDDSDIAWHDACFNSQSIGLEHEGYVQDPATWYTDAMYASSAQLVSWLCDQYGIPKTRSYILGHGEAPDCSDHTDPGPGWDWNYYMSLIQSGGCQCQPGEVQQGGCGNCGTHTRSCGSNCQWGGWSSCQGQGPCSAGTVESAPCCDCGTTSRSCDAQCQWGGWSGCNGPDPGGACATGEPGPCADGTVRCVDGCSACVSDYTPVAEICDTVDNDCSGEVDDGSPEQMGEVVPAYAARLLDASFPAHLEPGDEGEAWAVFRNEGSEGWPEAQIWLAPMAPDELQPSALYDQDSWPAWDVAALCEDEVAPGQLGRFVWTVRAPLDAGSQPSETFRLEDPAGEPLRCPSPELAVTVHVGPGPRESASDDGAVEAAAGGLSGVVCAVTAPGRGGAGGASPWLLAVAALLGSRRRRSGRLPADRRMW